MQLLVSQTYNPPTFDQKLIFFFVLNLIETPLHLLDLFSLLSPHFIIKKAFFNMKHTNMTTMISGIRTVFSPIGIIKYFSNHAFIFLYDEAVAGAVFNFFKTINNFNVILIKSRCYKAIILSASSQSAIALWRRAACVYINILAHIIIRKYFFPPLPLNPYLKNLY